MQNATDFCDFILSPYKRWACNQDNSCRAVDEFYYVHQGQIDIFNFSRKPGSDSTVLIEEHKKAIELRKTFEEAITKGKFIQLSKDDSEIFAYQRTLNNKSVVIIINRNLVKSNDLNIKIKNIGKKSTIDFLKQSSDVLLTGSRLLGKLKPAEILILTVK